MVQELIDDQAYYELEKLLANHSRGNKATYGTDSNSFNWK